MLQDGAIWMAQGDNPCKLLLNQANRHGLIAGASGTGKPAEGFSHAGVPVFMADVKGDVTGMAQAGNDTEMQKRIAKFGLEGWTYEGCPCRMWDMLSGNGCPVRVTVSDMGPALLARLLGLTDVQEGVLNIVFRIADDKDMLLIDLKDLRAMLNYASEHADEYETTYGRIASQSVGAILRALIAIEDQGGDVSFGEPALDLADWFACAPDGRGYVNILNAAKLIQSPQVYSMFLLWMLSELFETLPEVGDLDKPKFVFFFDEAHLLFDSLSEELTDKIVQVVKLIRSKGVGVYFITQSPSDIPDEVLAQLSNRVQHGLRAYTPAVSFLDEEGRPSVVENAKVLPPQCLMAAASQETMDKVLADQAALTEKYGTAVDRESAFEMVERAKKDEEEADKLAEERAKLEAERAELEKLRAKEEAKAAREAEKAAERAAREAEKEAAREARERAKHQREMVEDVVDAATSFLGQIGREAGSQILRGLFGTRRRR